MTPVESVHPDESVHALNIYLFSYYLQKASTDNLKKSPPKTTADFQKIYQPILEKFQPQFGDHTNFAHELINDDPNIPHQKLLKPNEKGHQYKQWSSATNNPSPDQTSPLDYLLLYPQKLNGDTYALLLHIFRDQKPGNDAVKISEFPKFHPQDLLINNSQQGCIGRTLLVTAFLPENASAGPDNLRKISDNLSKKLFAENLPAFYQHSYILNSYICEYSQPKQKSDRFLIILYLTENTPQRIKSSIYWQLPELFLAYHKITYTFQISRTCHEQADQLVRQIEDKLEELIVSSNTTELETLKIKLKELIALAPKYSLQLRNLEYALNTINIQTENYQTLLKSFQDKTDDQLEFFQRFLTEQTFTPQIEYDLNYLKPASNLLDQAINSIRGLVDIQQTESDRSLERTIQILGVGLGVGGIASSTLSGYIKEPVSLTPDFSKPMHPGIFSLLISFLLGILAALGMSGFIYRRSLFNKIKKLWQIMAK